MTADVAQQHVSEDVDGRLVAGLEAGHFCRLRGRDARYGACKTSASVASNRSFCACVPTVMRSHSGMP